jgi:hypothetical protein
VSGNSNATRSRVPLRALRFDARTGVAQLVYAFDDGPELIVTITQPGAPFTLDSERAAAGRTRIAGCCT